MIRTLQAVDSRESGALPRNRPRFRQRELLANIPGPAQSHITPPGPVHGRTCAGRAAGASSTALRTVLVQVERPAPLPRHSPRCQRRQPLRLATAAARLGRVTEIRDSSTVPAETAVPLPDETAATHPAAPIPAAPDETSAATPVATLAPVEPAPDVAEPDATLDAGGVHLDRVGRGELVFIGGAHPHLDVSRGRFEALLAHDRRRQHHHPQLLRR